MTIERIQAHSLFILGAQKAGTTTLHDLLGQHPAIAAADPKEPNHYIKRAAEWPMILASGPSAMHELPYRSEADYGQIFAPDNKTRFFLDSSTGYFPYDEALDAIVAHCDQPRVIVVLREPVSRAYSAYNWARKVGWEPLPTFEEALEAESARRAKDFWFSYWYRGHGLYADRVAAVQARFPHHKFILFDDLRTDPERICQEIFDWLGLEPAALGQVQSNPSGLDRGMLRRRLRGLVTRRRNEQGQLAGAVRRLLPTSLLRSIKRVITDRLDAQVVAPEKLSSELRRSLAAHFEEDIAATEALIGRDLSAWRQS